MIGDIGITKRFGRAIVAAVMPLACLVACSAEQDGPRESEGEGEELTETVDRPFRKLDADQPGGPRHTAPFTWEPSDQQLSQAARLGPTRRDAETFAILVSHALEDQTPGSLGDVLLDQVRDDLPSDAIRSIEDARDFPGNRVVPGSRSFVRSSIGTASGEPRAVVLVAEKIESPALGDAPGQPFVFWVQSRITARWRDGRWILSDYQSTAASEYPRFSKWTWEGAMDSGRDWRRFSVGE